jgi:hypothetical protein
MVDPKIRSEIVTLLQEKEENTLEHIGTVSNFLNRSPIAQQLRKSVDKWDFLKT